MQSEEDSVQAWIANLSF